MLWPWPSAKVTVICSACFWSYCQKVSFGKIITLTLVNVPMTLTFGQGYLYMHTFQRSCYIYLFCKSFNPKVDGRWDISKCSISKIWLWPLSRSKLRVYFCLRDWAWFKSKPHKKFQPNRLINLWVLAAEKETHSQFMFSHVDLLTDGQGHSFNAFFQTTRWILHCIEVSQL